MQEDTGCTVRSVCAVGFVERYELYFFILDYITYYEGNKICVLLDWLKVINAQGR